MRDGYYLCYAWTGKQQKGTVRMHWIAFCELQNRRVLKRHGIYFAGLTLRRLNWVFAESGWEYWISTRGAGAQTARRDVGVASVFGVGMRKQKLGWDG